MKAFKIVGLHKSDKGRSCPLHLVCGEHLQEGDLLIIKRAIVGYDNGKLEVTLAAYKLGKDLELTCKVGFIPKEIQLFHFGLLENAVCKVDTLLAQHSNTAYGRYNSMHYQP